MFCFVHVPEKQTICRTRNFPVRWVSGENELDLGAEGERRVGLGIVGELCDFLDGVWAW